MSNKHILTLTISLEAICYRLVFVRKAIIKNYVENFNFNIKFNWYLDATLSYIVIEELSFTSLNEKSLIYK